MPSDSLSLASLTALTEAAAAIASTLELDAVLATISRLACQVARAEASNVFLLDGRSRKLTVAAATGHKRDALVGQEFDAELGIPGHVVHTGKPITVINAANHPRFSKAIDDISSFRARSIIAAPMVHRGEAIGVIEVVNRLDGTDLGDADLKILQIFATLAASATQNARTHEQLRSRYEGLRDSLIKPTTIIGGSRLLREALALCDKVAPSTATVLILGETGTGKELCARYIHNASKRRHETFAAINCAAMPANLLESELFGHEKGAFTSAHAQKSGWFELAHQGTLFLDEIGDISRALQAKLLRVLQEKEFVRVGGTKSMPCDVRIIAATNRNLKNMMADGLFREDLYYRLSVFPIRVPALRERQEDIPLLVGHFVRNSAKAFRIPELRVARETMEVLTRYGWPGNIRELQNVIERSVLMSEGQALQPCHLPPDMEAAVTANGASENTSTLYGQERILITNALKDNDWNQSQAARALGITRDHLRHRVKKYNIQKPADPSLSPAMPNQQ